MAIHVAITRRVLPGKEEEFKDALRRFLGDSFLHGGVHGASMMTALPGSESREIGILRTFADQAERDALQFEALQRLGSLCINTDGRAGLSGAYRSGSVVPLARSSAEVENGGGDALRCVSYKSVSDLCSWPAHSGAPPCIQDFDCC